MRISRIALIVFLLAVFALAVAACGSDEDAEGGGDGGDTPASAQQDAEVCDAFEEPEQTGDGDELQWAEAPQVAVDESATYTATVATDKGEFTMELDPGVAPIAVNNFVFLACQGFYDGVPIHRVVPGFVFQTGDPTGSGTGGPGYTIEDEKVEGAYEPYTVSMARTPAPNSAGSQWFVALDDLDLPPEYVIFGTVVDGMDVVDEIGTVEVELAPSGEQSQPVEPLEVTSVRVTT